MTGTPALRQSERNRSLYSSGRSGALACGSCGAWTPPEEQHGVELVESLGYAPQNVAEELIAARRGAVGQPFATSTTRCAACVAQRERAEQLVTDWPGAAQAGELVYFGRAAVDAVEAALTTAAAAGAELRLTAARDLRLAVENLGAAGRSMTWRSRFAGRAVQGVETDGVLPWGLSGHAEANAAPWAHFDLEQLAARVRRLVGA